MMRVRRLYGSFWRWKRGRDESIFAVVECTASNEKTQLTSLLGLCETVVVGSRIQVCLYSHRLSY